MMLVFETVGRPNETTDVQSPRLTSRDISRHDNPIARPQRVVAKPELRELPTVVHFERPLLRSTG